MALMKLFKLLRRPGRIVLILRGEEIVIRRTLRPGILNLHVERAEPDAEWVLSRTPSQTA